jgi:hypothetical protein
MRLLDHARIQLTRCSAPIRLHRFGEKSGNTTLEGMSPLAVLPAALDKGSRPHEDAMSRGFISNKLHPAIMDASQ